VKILNIKIAVPDDFIMGAGEVAELIGLSRYSINREGGKVCSRFDAEVIHSEVPIVLIRDSRDNIEEAR